MGLMCLVIYLTFGCQVTAQPKLDDKGGKNSGEEQYQKKVEKALKRAGENKQELLSALEKVDKSQKEGLMFLIANMPTNDLKALRGEFLLEELKYAYLAREKTSWGKDIPEELFIKYVLPYRVTTEKCDSWRKGFYEKFLPLAEKCKTPTEFVIKVNSTFEKTFGVKYSTARRRADQSPKESMETGIASCTGLATLLIDAARSVGILARMAGIPMWTNNSGNHNWVEFWDGKEWRYLQAWEPSETLEKAEAALQGRAALSDDSKPRNRIYASSFAKIKGKTPFGMWAPNGSFNVTNFYKLRRKLEVTVVDKDGKPAKANVEVRLNKQLMGVGDADNTITFDMGGGYTYHIKATAGGVSAELDKEVSEKDEITKVEIKLTS